MHRWVAVSVPLADAWHESPAAYSIHSSTSCVVYVLYRGDIQSSLPLMLWHRVSSNAPNVAPRPRAAYLVGAPAELTPGFIVNCAAYNVAYLVLLT
jgi:hypothetical protein